MDLSPGRLTHLGRYQIVRVLGRGAMGVVYEGLDPRLNRPVAIKTILKSHLIDETMAAEYAARFEREAQAVGRLAHPHIVTLHDFGVEGEIAYIVMEFIRGRELASHFEAGDYFDLPEAVRIMGELLDALAYAHSNGIVHRDIKPANVMIDESGRVKLTDFGVARVSDANTDRTQPGTMVGTPSYMSPEQILGLAVGSRTDIFAAGVVLYQFLAHDKPFKGTGPWDVQRRIVNDPAVPPSKLNAAVPRTFDAIVAKALAKQPEQRYADAAAFAADLRTALAKLPPARASAIDVPLDLAHDPTLAQPRPTAARQAVSRRLWLALPVASIAVAGAWWLAAAQRNTAAPTAPAAEQARPTPPASAPADLPALAVTRPAMPAPASAAAMPASAIPHSNEAIGSNPVPAPAPKRQNAPSLADRGPTAASAPPVKRRADPRCADLLQQAQLGETLSPESLAYLRKECR